MLLYTYVCVYIIYCFANIIWQLPWIPQKLSFTVSTVLSWKLLWDGSDRGRVARDLFTKWFVPSKISRKTWDTFRSLRQMWPQDSAEMIQDSWQFQHIMYFIKDQVRFLLLIGSNDQTHLIDPNSLSEMKYHDCFDSFVCFFVTGYHHLQSPEKHCQQHRHRHQEVDFKHLFPTFSSCKGWSVLRMSLILKPWQGCCFRAEKNNTSTHLAWQHCNSWVSNQKS